MKKLPLLLLVLLAGCHQAEVKLVAVPPPDFQPSTWNERTYYESQAKKVGNEKLYSTYLEYNSLYFEDKLSTKAIVAWDWHETDAQDDLGVSQWFDECDTPKIYMSPRLAFAENSWVPILIHEMLHVYMGCVTKEDSGGTIYSLGVHSRAFHQHMRELICQGAFEDFGEGCSDKMPIPSKEDKDGWVK